MTFNQLTLTGGQPTRTATTCPTCHAEVRRIIAGDVCGWPATVSQHPTDRTTALAAVVTGRRVYVHRRHKHAASWTELDAGTIGSKHVATGDHHLEHVCGHDPPPLPPTPTAQTTTGPPPF